MCGDGTVAIKVSDGGFVNTLCAFDYPVWGILPEFRPNSDFEVAASGQTIKDHEPGNVEIVSFVLGQSDHIAPNKFCLRRVG